jgi:hypothetical protein
MPTTEYISVWDERGHGVNERCILMHGCYLGVVTGDLYPMGPFHHSPVYRARVVASTNDETGMYYRSTYNHAGMIGEEVEVEKAHFYQKLQVWRTLPNVAYLSENEIELLDDEPIR